MLFYILFNFKTVLLAKVIRNINLINIILINQKNRDIALQFFTMNKVNDSLKGNIFILIFQDLLSFFRNLN